MSSVSSLMIRSKVATAPHPVFAIDGISLEVWLGDRYLPDALGNRGYLGDDFLGLVPAQGWLIDDDEQKLAWDRIESVDAGVSTVIPLLVCGDDVDLKCTVIVAEQVASEEDVTWQRFGFSRTAGRETGISTAWIREIPPVTFSRAEFLAALATFKSLSSTSWK